MIDINELPRAPFNILNSSVAKMVAEEDYEKTHPAPRAVNERQSRPRQRRPITREDVLKINRRHPRRRDISWPPSDNRSRSRSSSEEIHFDERVRKRHEIFHLKEMFDQGAIATSTTTPLAVNERNYMRTSSMDRIGSDLDIGSPVGNRGHEMDAQFNIIYRSAKRQSRPRSRRKAEWPPRSCYDDDDVNNNVELSKKTFYLPETELHIGNIEPIRAYWYNISARSSSTPSHYSCSPVRRGSDGDELKRWRSHENITTAHYRSSVSPCNRHSTGRGAGDSHKKDNLPLERNKSNSYNELPPLKPRREDRKDVHHTKKKLNLNNSQQSGRRMWEPGRWISDKTFKLNIQQQQAAAAHLESGERKSDKRAEHNADHSQQANYDMAESLVRYETNKSSCNDSKSHHTIAAANYQQPHTSRVQSVNDDSARNDAINMGSSVSVRFDEHGLITCLNPENTPHEQYYRNPCRETSERESPFIVTQFEDEDLRKSIPKQIYSETETEQTSKLHQKTINLNINSKEEKYKWNPDEHMSFDRGASPTSSHHHITSKENQETESLLLKRSLVEEAITQDIQRISEYMKRAEQEALSADRYANESIAITPLQAILKQIVLSKAFFLAGDSISSTATTAPFPKMALFDPMTIAVVMQVENMPVVDQALLELVALSRTLEAFDSTNNSTDNNFHLKEACITELQSDGNEMVADIATASVRSVSPVDPESDAELESGPDLEAAAETDAIDSTVASSSSRTASGTPVDKIVHSKNILSGYLITKQSQEELFKKIYSDEMDTEASEPTQSEGMYCSLLPIPNSAITQTVSSATTTSLHAPAYTTLANKNEGLGHVSHPSQGDYVGKQEANALGSDNVHTTNEADYNREQGLHIDNSCDDLLVKAGSSLGINPPPSCMLNEKIMDTEKFYESNTITMKTNEKNDKLMEQQPLNPEQQKICQIKNMTSEKVRAGQSIVSVGESLHASKSAIMTRNLHQEHSACNAGEACRHSDLPLNETYCNRPEPFPPIIPWRYPEHQYPTHKSNQAIDDKLENSEIIPPGKSLDEYNYCWEDYGNADDHIQENLCGYCMDSPNTSRRSRCRTRLGLNSHNRFRSASQPSSSAQYPLPPPLTRQHSLDSSESQFYASPRLYMSGHFTPGKGYKRVAWPPVDSAPVYATVPQPQNPSPSIYESSQNGYRPQATQAFQPVNNEQPGQNYQTQNNNNYQPQQQQQQYYTQPQQQRQAPPYIRGQSAGVIQLRKEAPVSQQPAPVYTSQPATATLRGGSNMRGDLKWPPPEYKAQAAVENEERRRIALGPVCRPRRVQKDYSNFFAKNALNHYYPGYKIPPGTQHMYTQY